VEFSSNFSVGELKFSDDNSDMDDFSLDFSPFSGSGVDVSNSPL